MKFDKAISEFRAMWDGTDPLLRNAVLSPLKAMLQVAVREGPRMYAAMPEPMREAAIAMALRIFKEEVSPFGVGGEQALLKLVQAFPEATKEVETWLK